MAGNTFERPENFYTTVEEWEFFRVTIGGAIVASLCDWSGLSHVGQNVWGTIDKEEKMVVAMSGEKEFRAHAVMIDKNKVMAISASRLSISAIE